VKRRAVLTTLVFGLAGCSGPLPRPSGPRGPPEEPEGEPRQPERVLDIETWDFGETEAGRLRVFGEVRNDGGSDATATVTATVGVGEETYTGSDEVTVESGATAGFDIVFEVAYEEFSRNGSIDLNIEGA
jgi:hypothetical protein